MSAPAETAVLTGDLVRSSRLAPAELDRALAALAEGAAATAAWAGADARFTRFRGDGWQCLAPAPRLALRTALVLKAHLRRAGRGFETRIAIGIGAAELPAAGDLAAASGAAFRLAGEGLDVMRRTARIAIAWEHPPPCAAETAAIAGLADTLAARWTPTQAETLAAALAPAGAPQAALAEAAGVSQQMVAKRLRAAGEAALAAALEAIEARA